MESVLVEGEEVEEEEEVVMKAAVFGVVVGLGTLKVSSEGIFRSWVTEAVCDGGGDSGGGCGGCGGARGTSTGAMGGDGGGFGVWAGVDSGE